VEAGVPVLPIVTWGGQRVWTAGRRPVWHRGVPVTMRVGEPIAITPSTTAASLTEQLRLTLTEMTESVQRAYPAPAPGEPDWWQPAYLGGSAPTQAEAREIEAAAMQKRLERKAQRAAGKRPKRG
jgi:hypothetical protein